MQAAWVGCLHRWRDGPHGVVLVATGAQPAQTVSIRDGGRSLLRTSSAGYHLPSCAAAGATPAPAPGPLPHHAPALNMQCCLRAWETRADQRGLV